MSQPLLELFLFPHLMGSRGGVDAYHASLVKDRPAVKVAVSLYPGMYPGMLLAPLLALSMLPPQLPRRLLLPV